MENLRKCSGFTNVFVLQVADEKSIKQHSEQTALMTFINPYSRPVSGVLTVAGAGLLQGKVQFR